MTEQNAEPTLQQIATRLNPTKAFYISHEKDFTDVIDLTGQLGILYSLELGISEVSLRTAQTIANGQPRLPNAYSVEPDNFLDTRHTLRNYKGEDVGGMRKKVLSFAKATLSFLAQGEGEASPVEVRPVGAKNKVQEFRIDGIKYRCEVEKGRNEVKRFDRVFFKEKIGRMAEVGRYSQTDKYKIGGLLLLDAGQLDEKVAILMACYGDGV